MEETKACSIILAAGRGTRMKGYSTNKALLPLIPDKGPFQGKRPFIEEILENLPQGPKAVVVNYRKDDLISALKGRGVTFIEQPLLDGTGGALMAAKGFIEACKEEGVIVTMGDVPLVRKRTFVSLLKRLELFHVAVLGFVPDDKRQFGLLVADGERLLDIVEWKYWKDWDHLRLKDMKMCNSGIYAFKKHVLLDLLPDLKKNPHCIEKEIEGKLTLIKEYFLTDIVKLANQKGYKVGFTVAESTYEVMGVDDPQTLKTIQQIYATI